MADFEVYTLNYDLLVTAEAKSIPLAHALSDLELRSPTIVFGATRGKDVRGVLAALVEERGGRLQDDLRVVNRGPHRALFG